MMIDELCKLSIPKIVDRLNRYENVSAKDDGRRISVLVDTADSYLVWPYGKQWCRVMEDQQSDRFHGDIEWFIERYITKRDHCPTNSGKVWSNAEKEQLLAMCAAECTINQIAEHFHRYPNAVAQQLMKLQVIKIPHDFAFWIVLYEQPVSEVQLYAEPYKGPNTSKVSP